MSQSEIIVAAWFIPVILFIGIPLMMFAVWGLLRLFPKTGVQRGEVEKNGPVEKMEVSSSLQSNATT